MSRPASYEGRLRATPPAHGQTRFGEGAAQFARAYYLLVLTAEKLADEETSVAPGTPAGDLLVSQSSLWSSLEEAGCEEARKDRDEARMSFAGHVGNPVYGERWYEHLEQFREELDRSAEANDRTRYKELQFRVANALWEHPELGRRIREQYPLSQLNECQWKPDAHKSLNNPVTEAILGSYWRHLERSPELVAKATEKFRLRQDRRGLRAKLLLRLEYAAQELQGRKREVFLLRLEGYKYSEIAAELNIEASTARSHRQRAVKQIRERHPELREFLTAV